MVRTWATLMFNSAAMAAIAVAAQLGVADVLGIVRWDAAAPDGVATWSPLLTWVAFTYAVGVLVGATVGRRPLRRPSRPEGVAARITATVFAGLGAGVATPMAWLPADAAKPPEHVDPMLVVSMTSAAGIVVGMVAAMVALSAPAVAGGLRVAVVWLWLVAIGSATVGVVRHQPYPPPRLGVLDAPSLVSAHWWTGPKVMIAMAAILGLVVAGVARWGGAGRFGVAVSGLGGPAVVAAAYLVAGPGSPSERPTQFDPYLAALLATGAGLVASVLVAMPGRRTKAPLRPKESSEPERLVGEVVADGLNGPPQQGGYPEPAYASATWPHPISPAPGGSTYGGATFGSATAYGSVQMGQPAPDPHESWLRDIGPAGMHAFDDPQP